ncbi:MAG: DNA double-strand break repair nuclease NurA [Candidatus Altiarchaeota archaeon]
MRELRPDFSLDESVLKSKSALIEGLDSHRNLDRGEIRRKVEGSGGDFKRISINDDAGVIRMLACDSSMIKRELRYHALWGLHTVVVYAEYDGGENSDPLVGEGTLPYRELKYESYVDFGVFIPYSDIEERANALRVAREYSALLEVKDGLDADILLVDGSLYTNTANLQLRDNGSENSDAVDASRRLLSEKRVVGMVEDSHATDLSRSLGFNCTNTLLFDIALDPMEYVVDKRQGINVCYLKLPGKRMESLPSGESAPMTVRWEFNYDNFQEDLESLVSVWINDRDHIHPQVYPIRIADYLTRRIKVSGLVDRVVEENNLELRYRDSREGVY